MKTIDIIFKLLVVSLLILILIKPKLNCSKEKFKVKKNDTIESIALLIDEVSFQPYLYGEPIGVGHRLVFIDNNKLFSENIRRYFRKKAIFITDHQLCLIFTNPTPQVEFKCMEIKLFECLNDSVIKIFTHVKCPVYSDISSLNSNCFVGMCGYSDSYEVRHKNGNYDIWNTGHAFD